MVSIAKKDKIQEPSSNSKLNKRIDKKLEIVADMLIKVSGEKFVKIISSMFNKKIFFEGFRYIKELDLRYYYENRFMAINYNLEMRSEIENEKFKALGNLNFRVRTKGKFSVSKAEWVCDGVDCKNELTEELLKGLNNKLILDRIITLDISKIVLSHEEGSPLFRIKLESIVGSSIWILIPPVTNLIKPTREECIRFLEFFELVGAAIS